MRSRCADAAPAGTQPADQSPERRAMLKPGDNAPDFTLPADDGSDVTLSDLRGQKVVLFFYGKDFTPG